MKKLPIYFLMLVTCFAVAQYEVPTTAINGEYHLFEVERGINNQPTKTKLFEFGENNGVKLLAVAACEKCMPAIYTYQEEDSKRLGIPVFFNSSGLYALSYDKESFVIVLVKSMIADANWENFAFSNFYSKSNSKVTGMTKEKIANYAVSLSKK